ncbi:MAG TPA: hypothetical protein VND64_32595 [Pirellulales bacterium]|nr:hypothetical protein [Pirellulales bacterium]
MDDEAYQKISAEFPFWTVVDKEKCEQLGLAKSVVRFTCIQRESPVCPLFTDDDLAQRFLETYGSTGRVSVCLAEPPELLGLLTEIQAAGCKYVGFDISTIGGHSTGDIPEIGEVLEWVRRKAAETEADDEWEAMG